MQLPVDFLHWSLAFLPILILAFLLVQLRWTAQQAGAAGIFIAAGIAWFFFRASPETLAVAGAKGVWDAVFILLVIWPALFLHEVMSKAGGYEALRQSLTRMSRNELFDIVALGWVFASFLQGIAGFGTPIAIVAPLLVAIGVRPVYAVVIPIIAHIWAKFFGTLGSGWIATLQVVDLGEAMVTAGWQTGLLMSIQAILGGFTVVWLYGRWAAVRHAWPLVLIIASIQGFGQTVVTLFDPVLAAFIPATVAMAALYPLSLWPRYAEPAKMIVDRPAMQASETEEDLDGATPTMSAGMSFFPYILLTALALITSVVDPLRSALGAFTIGFPFPEVTTGYGVSNEAATPYSPLAPLTHPGASLAAAALVTWALYRARGYYGASARKGSGPQNGVLKSLFASGVPASVPVVAFLVMAALMNHSGQNETLALGIAAIAPAYLFAFLSNGIGVVGAFTTSSSTSSNVLFSDLQVTVARLKELPDVTILAAQSAGGAIGNAIAPANAVMGASTAGITGQEGAIIRKALPWTVATFLLTGVATIVLVWWAG